jgi:hypothetical protein
VLDAVPAEAGIAALPAVARNDIFTYDSRSNQRFWPDWPEHF